MKLAAAKTDVGLVDTATQSTGRTQSDKQTSDGTAPPFEDLLADLEGDPKSAVSTDDVVAAASGASRLDSVSTALPAQIAALPSPSKAISGAARIFASPVSTFPASLSEASEALQVDQSLTAGVERTGMPNTVTIAALATTDQSPQAIETSNEGATIIDAFVSMLGKDAANGRNAKSSTPSQVDDNRVATLLKRLASKADATDASPPTTGTAASVVPDAFSALLVGQVLSTTPAPASSSLATSSAAMSPTVATDAVKDAVGVLASSGLERSARVSVKEVPASEAAGDTVVTDVNISSHLTPFSTAQSAQNGNKSSELADAKIGSNEIPASERHSAQESQQTLPISISHEDPSPVLAAQSNIVGPTSVPIQAIAKAIGALVSQPAAADVSSSKPTVAVARTMTLQMNPAALGTVAIKMHMTGQTLDVQLSISDPQTLGMVTRERDNLAAALHDKQYTLNSLVIQDAGASIPLGGNNASQGDTTGSRTAQDQRGGDPSAEQRSSGREEQGAGQSPSRERQGQNTEPRASGDARRDSLFV